MNTVPLSGTDTTVSFFPDDTIDTVRQRVALNVGSHPDRLFIEVKAKLSADYYSSDPRNWTDLFLRMSYDGRVVTSKVFRTYLEQIRPGSGVEHRDITRDEWESHPEDLQKLFNPEKDFEEWRILGVEEGFVMPIPPEDLPELKEARIPLPRRQSLFETLHSYEITEFRATEIPSDASDLVHLNYTPFLTSETPANLEGFRNQIEGSQKQLNALLGLGTPTNTGVSILRAKWFVPWVSTRFSAPHTRFEQIFYGMTVSETTPYIGFFTGKDEAMRHKFYVKDPKTKKPFLDVPIWKSWLSSTQPQRRLPTLLLYRGNSDRSHFDRIAITSKDITLSTVRSKESEDSLEDLRKRLHDWLLSLDALIPFVRPSDIELSRWELGDLTAYATYKNELRDLDLLRFGCLQNLFGIQGNTFRLLRAEHGSTDMSPQDLQAYQILTDEDIVPSAQLLQQEMGISAEAATDLIEKFRSLQEEQFNFEKDIKGYPIIKFGGKDVTITFVSNLNRVLRYVDILRYIVTPGSDSEELNQVCPRRMEEVAAEAVVPQKMVTTEDEGEEFDDFEDIEGGARKMKVEEKKTGTYNYFNERLQKFNPDVFDKALYPKKCDKPRQVIVLTPEDRERIAEEKGIEYTFSDVAENEMFAMEDPEGTAICPPFWCMRDEIPLREDQLEEVDGVKACPVCGGKLRSSDSEDPTIFTVIARDSTTKFPKLMEVGEKKFPCCYKKPGTVSTTIAVASTDDTYVLTGINVPELRLAYVGDDTASRLGLKTNYDESVGNGRLISGKKDVFRLGIGRPSKTLPLLIKGPAIKQPKDARDKVKLCSFYRTWSDMGTGASQEDRIIDGVQRAYETGTMNVMDELEYVTTFLQTSVMRVDTRENRLICGFWSDVIDPATRTILMLDNDVLVLVSRRKEKRGPKFDYESNIHKMPFSKEGMTTLLTNYRIACATNIPSFDDAIAELQAAGKTSYQIIEDPFKRSQALLIPGEIILPFRPITRETISGVFVRSGYADIKDEELPTGVSAREFLKTTKHSGYKVTAELQNVRGEIVELLLTSGFRVPIQPEEAEVDDMPREVLETIRIKDEASLTSGEPNTADVKQAREIMYSAEVYEFLLYSLSKDVQRSEYESLRNAIQKRSAGLAKELKSWLKQEAYWDDSITPPEFVNKVRTPCGQLTNKDSCSKSTLCGWHKKTCKVRVKPIVDKDAILRRITKTLMENDKQRALVLDERLSPFFSTVLYLELPNEWITSDI
jgi:hypothetical protein